MKYKKILLLLVFIGVLFVTVSCDVTTTSTSDTTASASVSTSTSTDEASNTDASVEDYTVYFVTDEFVNVITYSSSDLNDGALNTEAETIDGKLYFSLDFDSGYILNNMSTSSSNYSDFKTVDSVNNVYEIKGLTSDITINISSILDTYDETTTTAIEFTSAGVTVTNNNGGVSVDGSNVTIRYEGSYIISGTSSEGTITVSASEEDSVYLDLLNLSLSSSTTSPIYVSEANDVSISVLDGYTATIQDLRSAATDATETNPNAAIYSEVDLSIKGLGTMNITGNYYNGIVSEGDLEISKLTLNVSATNNGIKGNDSLVIYSGTLDILAKTGDGLKTSNSDVSSTGKQRGDLVISGGTITINAASDGIDAAHDLIIDNNPTITIYTSDYATGVGEVATQSEETLYLRISSSVYSSNYRYAVYFSNPTTGTGEFVNADYVGTAYVSGRLYYFFSLDIPSSSYTTYQLFRYTSSASNSLTSYNAASESASLNSYYDMLIVGSQGIVGSTIVVTWGIYGSQTTTGTTYSTKGMKADNSVTINGGTITIKSYDDGIHANSDTTLDTGSNGYGDVTINGGVITITSKDDGIHADRYLTISDGEINILSSYEGLEGNQIAISGGTTYVVATDDGINASGGSLTTKITISGGYVDISVGTGDTDAIDSNGAYYQTGGFVVSRSALSGGAGGALDTDSTTSITGGTFIGIGVSERVATSSGDNLSTGAMRITISSGTYTVVDSSGTVIMTFTTPSAYTYSQIWISSNLFTKGTTYTLQRNGTTVKTWTQN